MAAQIVWFRQDLRLADQPALRAAAAAGPVLPVFILDEASHGVRPLGGASRWWLHHSLASLGAGLSRLGAPLLLRRGEAVPMLHDLARETGADAIHAIGLFEPAARTQEAALAKTGLLRLHGSVALGKIEQLKTGSGSPFKVFTPFWRALLDTLPPPVPLPGPKTLKALARLPQSDSLEQWSLLPSKPDWAAGFGNYWQPGEAGAQAMLKRFAPKAEHYGDARDSVGENGTSRLSAHLHFGELSPAQAWHGASAPAWHRQLAWRDFSLSLLRHAPDLDKQNWRRDFDAFPWREDPTALRLWQQAKTGYPLVDAAMRQLWQTGWMHNRARMVVASFLIKHLLIDWRAGERWFWDTLVDADLANNAASWQWTAGSGADAAPYFRIFNPIAQGERFDPQGVYVRRWVPELAKLPDAFIHKPWTAPPLMLADAGVRLGQNYPYPMVDHDVARRRALDAFQTLKAAA